MHWIVVWTLLFLAFAAEGDFTLLAAAVLAHGGHLPLAGVIAVAALGNAAGCVALYELGRGPTGRRLRGWVTRRRNLARHLEPAQTLVRRRGATLMIASRYMVGFRYALPAACGIAGVGRVAFLAATLVGVAIWAVPVGLAGFYAAGLVQLLLSDMVHVEKVIVAVALVAAAVVGAARLRPRPSRTGSGA